MFAKICILIENTPRSMTMPDGTGTFAVWARNRILTYDRLEYYCKRGSLHSHITPWLVFYAIGICLLRCRPVNRLYILTAAEGR